MMNPIHEIELRAQSFGGDAIGKLPDGKSVFVPFGIQGERVAVEIIEDKRNYARGRIKEILIPSLKRIKPKCPHFQECGGCHYQHLSYPDQLETKQGIVLDQLNRIGKFIDPPMSAIMPSFAQWNYRNTSQFHLSASGKLGFQRISASGVTEIRECHLPLQPINDIWPLLEMDPKTGIQRVSIRCGSDNEILVGLESHQPDVPEFEVDFPISVVFIGPDGNILLSGEDFVLLTVKDITFKVSASSFFQVNLLQAEAMVDHILKNINLPRDAVVVDAYCGVGLFSAFLAPKVSNLIGIELSESSCNDYADNLSQCDNVSLYIGAVEEVLPNLDITPNVILLDPPRAGMDAKALQGVISSAAEQIIYISCDPATLSRDLQKLVQAGYRLEQVTPFDLFPQTYHIESIAILSK